jgi:hypothetical protein
MPKYLILLRAATFLIMKQITINIKEDKYQIFRDFIESLDYAKIIDEKKQAKNKKKEAIIKSIKTGLKEVELIKKGELKAIPLKDLLNEL